MFNIKTLRPTEKNHYYCFLLPRLFNQKSIDKFAQEVNRRKLPDHIFVCAGYEEDNGQTGTITIFKKQFQWFENSHQKSVLKDSTQVFPSIMEAGPLRIGICSEKELFHPETAVACSKLGCDLVIVSAGELDQQAPLIFGIKSIEKCVIAVSSKNMAFICEPPVGHAPWKEKKILKQGNCRMSLDSKRTRQKRFQDRLDFEVLLNPKFVRS